LTLFAPVFGSSLGTKIKGITDPFFDILFARALRATQIRLASGEQMNRSPYLAPFTPAHGRAGILKILLIAGAIATGLLLVVDALSLVFTPLADDQDVGDNPIGAAILLLTFLPGVLSIIISLATVVLFLMWLYRAYGNLRAFDPSRLINYSPIFAVGSFFIPFANLVVPYRAVEEVWQKSVPPHEPPLSKPGTPAWFPLWWLFWLLSSFVNNISMRTSFDENVAHTTATTISIVASALSIVAAVFAYRVVDAIDKRQEETSRQVNLGKFSGPPPPPTNIPVSEVAPTPGF
jgi:uncharacterized protein DUF4328